MTDATQKILVIDRDAADREQLCGTIRAAMPGCTLDEADSVEAAMRSPDLDGLSCIVLDVRLPARDGLSALGQVARRCPGVAIIMSTGQGEEMSAREAIMAGAFDCVVKGAIDASLMARVLANALEQSRLRQRLVDQRREMDRFANILVHDLKAPLHAMEYLSTCIEENIDDEEWEEMRENARELRGAARRSLELVDSVASYVQQERAPGSGLADMARVTEGALANLRLSISESGAEIEVGELPCVIGERAQLVQLIQNLVQNAIKFCRADHPRLKIGARSDAEGGWIFDVLDNGIGIDREDAKRIFTAFTRLNAAEAFSGTGLGLATCARIVHRHGGEIWCEPGENGGTVFRFNLLAAPGESRGPSPAVAVP